MSRLDKSITNITAVLGNITTDVIDLVISRFPKIISKHLFVNTRKNVYRKKIYSSE